MNNNIVFDGALPLFDRIEIDITYRCNQRCVSCNRRCTQAPSDEDMPIDEIDRFIAESRKLDWRWGQIHILGGEPTLHKDYVEIFHRLKAICGNVLVRTNGRMKPVEGVNYAIDAKDYEHRHMTNVDVTCLEEPLPCNHIRACWIPGLCGLGLTVGGYYCCSPGAAIDRMLGLNVGLRSLADVTQQAVLDQEFMLCPFCGHSPSCVQRPVGYVSPFWKAVYDRYNRENIAKNRVGRFKHAPCFKCGTLTGRAGRYDDDLKLDPNVDLRPICDTCAPAWIVMARLKDGAVQPLTDAERNALRSQFGETGAIRTE
jgi:hypothetical protein